MNKIATGKTIAPALVAGALAGGAAFAPAPAAAQRVYTYDHDRGAYDRAAGPDRGVGRDAYERGYRLGREDERMSNERRYGRGGHGLLDRDAGICGQGYGPNRRDRGYGYGPHRGYSYGYSYGYGSTYHGERDFGRGGLSAGDGLFD